ncbi:hypothetical protein WICMUC_001105 [Wickerhamomyces mucosus]|uniref:Uncharacterized protein n=1 Tax=Wickerhamomyces mucosus TaxID=1378264 RepID=A0A9P8TI73_9ASCO|nr:hypothetical protein WICMUC_001105 [Wickerhamomyces mucosus]
MSSSNVLRRGLDLIQSSPFKASLPPFFSPDINNSDHVSSLQYAKHSDIFSDAGIYLRSKDELNSGYHTGLTAKSLKNSSGVISESLHYHLSSDETSSHLKIKLLNEFALSQIQPDEKLLKLEEIQFIQKQIEQLKESIQEIQNQLKGNSRLIQNIFTKPNIDTEDLTILRTLTNSNDLLTEKLNEVYNDLESNIQILDRQYLLALSVSYFEDLDIKLTTRTNNIAQSSVEKGNATVEELLSYIVSLAVQRNIPLPSPVANGGSDSQFIWAKECLDTLIAQSPETSPANIQSKAVGVNNDKELQKLKIAMKDLQFANQFLTKQFEEERNLNTTVSNTHKKKNIKLEKKLSENIITLEKVSQRSILIEHEKKVLEQELDEKFKEVQKLQKQITTLKLDNLGSTSSPSGNSISPGQENKISPLSPVTGISIYLDNDYENKGSFIQNPKTPLLQQNINNYNSSFSPASPPKVRSSVSLMRKEFRKIVSDLQSNFEIELDKEKSERRRLQKLVELYKNNENDSLL